MPVIQLKDDKTYGDVLYQLLYKIGGTFHGRPERVLIVNGFQLQQLQKAGLVEKNGEQRNANNGAKTK